MASKLNLYRKALLFFILMVTAIIFFSFLYLRFNVATNIRLLEGQSHYVNLNLPFVYVRADFEDEKGKRKKEEVLIINGSTVPEYTSLTQTLDLEAVSDGKVDLEFSLFGVLPLRNVTVNVLPEVKVMPGGQSIGINLRSRGVIVVDHYTIEGTERSPAKEAGIKTGDAIIAVEEEKVNDVNHTARLLEREAEEGDFSITIKREGEEKKLTVQPHFCEKENSYRLGIYIRDNAAGVGTLTFYHPKTRRYGALGHIIMDVDTREPVDISRGEIVNANIVNINKGDQGQPGEKTGLFMGDEEVLGNIDKNTRYGIFGHLHNPDKLKKSYTRPLPVGLASQVEKGSAKVLTVLEGQEISGYEVKIKDISTQSRPGDKGFIIKVTDPELFQKTGGIIQGMSGSPIIQNGRIIGAVTHVFVNNPRQGYGVFMEWMVEEAGIYP